MTVLLYLLTSLLVSAQETPANATDDATVDDSALRIDVRLDVAYTQIYVSTLDRSSVFIVEFSHPILAANGVDSIEYDFQGPRFREGHLSLPELIESIHPENTTIRFTDGTLRWNNLESARFGVFLERTRFQRWFLDPTIYDTPGEEDMAETKRLLAHLMRKSRDLTPMRALPVGISCNTLF